MCGIVGYVGKNGNCVRTLIDGLNMLEYRGYDSAGIAYFENKKIKIIKEKGKLENLIKISNLDSQASLGIGHTRWATHGEANQTNAHPHQVGKFTIVHNGIIENYLSLKKELIKEGYIFKSTTDTEVACAVIDHMYKKEKDILKILPQLFKKLEGSYAIGILCEEEPDNLYILKHKSPLIIGIGEKENYIASDIPAILDKTKEYIVVEDDDYGKITQDKIHLYHGLKEKKWTKKQFAYDASSVDKKGYPHYMLKEIHEQPEVFKEIISSYFDDDIQTLIQKMPNLMKYSKIRIIACGSAMHAALVGKQLLEEFANIKVEVNIASEFRYSKCFLDKDELVIAISQSGETADTLEALKLAKEYGNDTLGIINVEESSIARSCKMVLYTKAGKEIAVATTKAYAAQVTILSLMALLLAYQKNFIKPDELEKIVDSIHKLPGQMEELLQQNEEYQKIANHFKNYDDIFYIGRKIDYAIAQEGSLKLKEISYIHSEAYAAGELKHGTISLIEEGSPVVGIVTDEGIASKTISNLVEVKSRGANVLLITNRKDEDSFYDTKIVIPKTHWLFQPLLTIIPLQLIAYEVANIKGCDIDKPKNLAKSVTVE